MNNGNGRSHILTPLQLTLAGGTSGLFSRACVQPLDVLKIRFQLQSKSPETGRLTYTGLWQAASLIRGQEGVTALWKGHLPAQFLSITYGAVSFSLYEMSTNYTANLFPEVKDSQLLRSASNFLCGGVAGVASSFMCQPFDVLRTRLVAQGSTRVYTSIADAVRQMHAENGVKTFYKGMTPTMLMIFPYAGLHFFFYALNKQLWDNGRELLGLSQQDTTVKRLVCGACAGLSSKIVLLPLDTVKKRLQIQGFQHSAAYVGKEYRYTGMINSFTTILREEGVTALYKGGRATLFKAGTAAALSFTTYEQVCDLLEHYVWWKEEAYLPDQPLNPAKNIFMQS